MKRRTALLIINPRLGEKITQLSDMIAVFAAAGWKTDVVLKEFGGHTQQLAKAAAEAGYDLVIGCGGDGTLNQVVNGVMAAKNRHSIVGVIPTGTANVWAREIGLPEDPVEACLSLVNSEARKVDLGHMDVEALAIPTRDKGRSRPVNSATGGVHHFLLMAGLGIDAALMRRASTTLKEKLGGAGVAISAVKGLTSQKAFPVEIQAAGKDRGETLLWKGEALQVVVGNTRRYGNIGEATPDAFIDDGVLDVLVITAGNALMTMQQIIAFLVHHKPGNDGSEHFQGSHIRITAPASITMHLDGSDVKLAKSLKPKDKSAVEEAEDPAAVMVTYRFDALPRALRLAIPFTYDDALFKAGPTDDKAEATERQLPDAPAAIVERKASVSDNGHTQSEVHAALEKGRKVKVRGIVPDPQKSGTYIVAGGASEEDTAEVKPVALLINGKTSFFKRTGEEVHPGAVRALREGSEVIVEGKESKRGVVRAKRIVVD